MSIFHKMYALLTLNERRRALGLTGLMVVGMLLETLGIGLVIPAMTLMMQGNVSVRYPVLQPALELLHNPTQPQLIFGAMLGLVGIYLIKTLFLAFLIWRQTHFSFGVQAQLSQRLFTIYLRQPYAFHLQRNSAQLIRNASSEVSLFAGAINSTLILITEGLVLFGIALMLLFVEPVGALIVAFVLGGAAYGFHRYTRVRITRWGDVRHHHEGLRLQHLQQGIGGAKDVKLLGRESDFLEQYRIHNNLSTRMGEFQSTLLQLPRLMLELLAVLGLAILVLTMLVQGLAMESIVPRLGLFAAAAFRLMPSVNRVLVAVQSLRFSVPVINAIHAEFELAVPEPVSQQTNLENEFKHDIQLSNVTYVYPEAASKAIDGLSLKIHKGESVGFVGSSGSGKSTLIDIILGLLQPAEGQVAVDGQDIQINLRTWQNQIGYVPQSIFLTDDTLRRNVAFGLSDDQIDDAAVQLAIKAAQLDEFVAGLPEGLETVVGERGVRLSGGQRQRIGIARALYHDPAILVLDEATSALDTATESGVMQAVMALKGSKTILIVAHRLSTVEHCDRLYQLEFGRIVQVASPEAITVTERESLEV